jgi:hypothetical protein
MRLSILAILGMVLFPIAIMLTVIFYPQVTLFYSAIIYTFSGNTFSESEISALENLRMTLVNFLPIFIVSNIVFIILFVIGKLYAGDWIPILNSDEAEKVKVTENVTEDNEPSGAESMLWMEKHVDDWECVYCKNMNPADAYECIRCGAGKKKSVQMVR